MDAVVLEGNLNPAAPEGHDEKMAALGEGVVINGVAPAPAEETPVAKTEATPEVKAEATPEAKAEETPPAFSLTTYKEEFAKTGELSAESYEALAKAGYAKEDVDQYIAGQKALAANFQNEVYASVGGADSYKEMVTWAAANMAQADKDAFNQALEGTPAQAKLAVAGLFKQYKDAVGSQPTLLNGEAPSGSSSTTGFRSTSEMTDAMKDPRYKKDPAYRKDVEARVAVSTFM